MTGETLFGLAAGAPPMDFGEGDQSCDLFLPKSNPRLGDRWPVIIAIHGGCWRARYDRLHLRPFCRALADQGYAVWSIEYRRTDNGGEWPVIFEDVKGALSRLDEAAKNHPLDLSRVVVTGHSAGGHLALWLAAELGTRATALPGSNIIGLRGVLSLAGITDLADTLACGVCSENIVKLLGGLPDEVPDRYSYASPIERLPLGVPQILVHGRQDYDVPLNHVNAYPEAAMRAGDIVRLKVIEDCGHFELVAPQSRAWPVILESFQELFEQK